MAKPHLITLEEHNAAISECWHDWTANLPAKNGIACPECGKELSDQNPNQLLLSEPPKKRIVCTFCGFKGSRLA